MSHRLPKVFASSAATPSGSAIPVVSYARARNDSSASGPSLQVPSTGPQLIHIPLALDVSQGAMAVSTSSSPDFSVLSTPIVPQIEDTEYNALDLVPEPILEPWALKYPHHMSGSFPGPGGPSRFYKSRIPPYKLRTTQACDFCRHRKMKVSF